MNEIEQIGLMKGEKELIRTLEYEDIPLVKEMPTGIEDDYVIRIIHKLMQEEKIVGYFKKEMLVGIAGLTIFEGEAAVLGRLRTHSDFRKKGIASELMNTLQIEAFENPAIIWVGYATEDYNTGGNCIAPHLQMQLESQIVSSRISPHTIIGQTVTRSFNIVTEENKKATIEKYWKESGQSFFPYSIYYPLPYLPSLSSTYLEQVELFANDTGGFMLVKEEKGASYLHVKVLNETTLYSREMWKMVNAYAIEEARTIWIDLPIQQAKWLEPYSHQTTWCLYGQKRSLYNEMD